MSAVGTKPRPSRSTEMIRLPCGSATSATRLSAAGALPQGSLIISVLRDGRGFVPTADTVVEPGDQVLLVLDSGLEDQITPVFAPN